MSVPALPQSIGPSGSRSPRSPTPWTRSVSTSSSTTSAPSARTAAIVASVSADRPKPETRVSPVAERADEDGTVRDRLVARDGDVPVEGRHGLDRASGRV